MSSNLTRSLSYCPECGATGDYALLKAAALKVAKELKQGNPARLEKAIQEMTEVIDKKKGK